MNGFNLVWIIASVLMLVFVSYQLAMSDENRAWNGFALGVWIHIFIREISNALA